MIIVSIEMINAVKLTLLWQTDAVPRPVSSAWRGSLVPSPPKPPVLHRDSRPWHRKLVSERFKFCNFTQDESVFWSVRKLDFFMISGV